MKKTIIFIAGLFALTFLATACLEPAETPTTEEQEEFQAETAQEQLDEATVVEAVETKNKDLCGTVENEEQEADCLIKVDDRIILDEVRENGELDKCDEIQQDSTKEKCEIVANEKLEEIKAMEEMEEENKARDAQLAEDEANLYEITKGEPPTAEDCEVIKDPVYKEGCLISAGAVSEN